MSRANKTKYLKVALYVSRYEEGDVQTPPSLQYLAGYLVGKGLVEAENILYVDTAEQAIEFRPDILGVGSVSQCIDDAVRMAERIRASALECWTILGGYHVSALAEYLPDAFDLGVIGEGEVTLAEIVSLWQRSNTLDPRRLHEIKGICFRDESGRVVQTVRREPIEDLNGQPLPLRRLPLGQPWPYLFTARGCPYRCPYCASQSFWGGYRFYSAEYVVNEIARMVENFDVTTCYFIDDLFIAPKKRLRAIRRLLEERGLLGDKLRFKGFVRVNMVDERSSGFLRRSVSSRSDLVWRRPRNGYSNVLRTILLRLLKRNP